jgi:hypothetical protein
MRNLRLPPQHVSWLFCENICTDIHPKNLTSIWGSWKLEISLKALKLLFSARQWIFRLGHSGTHFLIYKHPISSQSLNESEKYKLIPPPPASIKIFHTLHEDKIELAFFVNNCLSQFAGRKKLFVSSILIKLMSSKNEAFDISLYSLKASDPLESLIFMQWVLGTWCARKKVIQLHPDKNPSLPKVFFCFTKRHLIES